MNNDKTISLSKARTALMRTLIGSMYHNELMLTRHDAEQILDAVDRKLDQDEIIKWFGMWLDRQSGINSIEGHTAVKLSDVIGAWDKAREQKAKK